MFLILPEFEMLFAETVEETCSLLAKYGRDAEIVAGGTDLFVKMKHKRLIPRYLINIKRIRGLDQIRYDANDGLRLGPLTTIQSVKDSAVVNKKFSVLAQAAGVLGTAQIRNLGTFGGNLANASPSAEFGPPLLTLEASVRCQGRAGERLVSMNDFFLSPGKSALKQDEVLTEVQVPDLPPKAQCVYRKHSLRKMDVAMAGAAVFIVLEGDVCRDVRIALGAVAPTPFRAGKAEETLKGNRLAGDSVERDLLDEVARVASGESLPIDDIRGYASYRRKIVGMLVRDGLEQALARARE